MRRRWKNRQCRSVQSIKGEDQPAWHILQQSNWAAHFVARIYEVAAELDRSLVEGIRAGGSYTGQQLLQASYKRTQHFRNVQVRRPDRIARGRRSWRSQAGGCRSSRLLISPCLGPHRECGHELDHRCKTIQVRALLRFPRCVLQYAGYRNVGRAAYRRVPAVTPG